MSISKHMKRIFPLLLSLMLIFSSVSAFAYNTSFNLNSGLPSSILINDKDNTIVGTLITSTLSNDSKQFLKDWFSGVSNDGNNNYHYYLYGSVDEMKKGYLRFVRCPFNVSCDVSFSRGTFHTPIGTEYLSFDFDSNNGFKPCYSSVGKTTVNSSITLAPKCDYFLIPFNDEISGNIDGVYKGALAFADDDGLLGNKADNPDEPNPPPVKPGEPPQIEPPKTPQGDPNYVPYDTSVWDGFYSTTTSSIGAITTIIYRLLAKIYGIIIILSLVKHYIPGAKKSGSNGSNSGGGGITGGRLVGSIHYISYD